MNPNIVVFLNSLYLLRFNCFEFCCRDKCRGIYMLFKQRYTSGPWNMCYDQGVLYRFFYIVHIQMWSPNRYIIIKEMVSNSGQWIVCLFLCLLVVSLGFYVPLENFSFIWSGQFILVQSMNNYNDCHSHHLGSFSNVLVSG